MIFNKHIPLWLHPYSRQGHFWFLLSLGIIFLLAWLAPLNQDFDKPLYYVPLHTLLEIGSVVLSILVFTTGWNTWKHTRALNIVLIACAFLCVGVLDLGHLLTHAGMPALPFSSNPLRAPSFWLAARFAAALALLLAVLVRWEPRDARFSPYIRGAFVIYALICTWVILFEPGILPEIYTTGAKLTPFRIAAEYIIVLFQLFSAIILLLLIGNREPDNDYTRNLLLALFILAFSELSVTLHSATTDTLNLLGHLYKVMAYFFIYRAVYTASIKTPLETLQNSHNRAFIEKELAEITIRSIGDAVITTDYDGSVLFLNSVAEKLTGWRQDEARGKHLDEVMQITNQISRKPISNPAYHAVRENRTIMDDPGNHALLVSRSGQEFSIEYTASPIKNNEGFVLGCVMVFHNITEKYQLLEQMAWQAGHDMLTHLPNRTLLSDRIGQAIAHAQRQEHLLLVCFMDLDGFKAVNDLHGHDLGDKLLIEVARRLINAVRSDDTVSRLGGDEFVLLLSEIRTMDEVDALLSRILDEMSRPYLINQQTLKISASIGATIYPFDSSDTDTLLRHADQAMYEAKQSGRNRFHLFDASMDLQLQEHHQQLVRLEKAVANNELVLYYQPKINLKTSKILGLEALVRWQHPQQGLLPPLEFLHLAEDSTLIIEIGNWVLHEALRQLTAWHAAGYEWGISVNLAARQLQCFDFIDNLHEILKQHPHAPIHKLDFEILESSALDDMTHVRSIILACQNLGITVSLDDFGSGYSSLAYLRHLPVNNIKIDQSFVRDMLDDEEDCALVEGILQMARVFKREVIAEGMETSAHGALLLNLGCINAQGNGIAKAMPAAEVPRWAAQFKPDPNWQNYPATLVGWGRTPVEITPQSELSLG